MPTSALVLSFLHPRLRTAREALHVLCGARVQLQDGGALYAQVTAACSGHGNTGSIGSSHPSVKRCVRLLPHGAWPPALVGLARVFVNEDGGVGVGSWVQLEKPGVVTGVRHGAHLLTSRLRACNVGPHGTSKFTDRSPLLVAGRPSGQGVRRLDIAHGYVRAAMQFQSHD